MLILGNLAILREIREPLAGSLGVQAGAVDVFPRLVSLLLDPQLMPQGFVSHVANLEHHFGLNEKELVLLTGKIVDGITNFRRLQSDAGGLDLFEGLLNLGKEGFLVPDQLQPLRC